MIAPARQKRQDRLTLLITGPGGVGKSPLNLLVRDGVARVESYRLRRHGPRDAHDFHYAHPDLYRQLTLLHRRLGARPGRITSRIRCFPETETVLLRVRGEWQALFLAGVSGALVKAELYAPVVPRLLEQPWIRAVLGELLIVILNPAASLAEPGAETAIRAKTRENCRRRGDSGLSVRRRTASIAEEAPAWRELLTLGAREYTDWPFPEYLYRDDRRRTLLAARQALLAGDPRLTRFLKTEPEILAGAAVFNGPESAG